MRISKRYYISAVVMLLLLLVVGWFFSDEYFARKEAVHQATPDWQRWKERIPPGQSEYSVESPDPSIPPDLKPSVLLQTDDSGRLLIKHTYFDDVYRFEAGSTSIEKVSLQDWTSAGGKVVNCRSQVERFELYSGGLLEIDGYPDYTATVNKQRIESYGRRIVRVRESGSNSKLAVVSVSGWLKGPGIGFVGLGGSDPKITGQRYLQVYDLATGGFHGSPVRVGGILSDSESSVCWSEDERFILLYTVGRWDLYREFFATTAS